MGSSGGSYAKQDILERDTV